MVNPTVNELLVKKMIMKELDINKSSEAYVVLETFFKDVEKIPLLKVFTEEGILELEDIISTSEEPHVILEFLNRIKNSIYTHTTIMDELVAYLTVDKLTAELTKDEYKFLHLSNKKELEEHYILVVVYIYINVMV